MLPYRIQNSAPLYSGIGPLNDCFRKVELAWAWLLQWCRGTFSRVKELVEKIDHYVQNSNRHAQPFVWTATADSIFVKVERLCERIYGTAHQLPNNS